MGLAERSLRSGSVAAGFAGKRLRAHGWWMVVRKLVPVEPGGALMGWARWEGRAMACAVLVEAGAWAGAGEVPGVAAVVALLKG